jgi:hypothetical protein
MYYQVHNKEMWMRMWRKRNPHTLLMGMQISTTTMENSMRLLKKIKIELLYDSAIPLLGIYSKEWKSGNNKGTCTPMLTVVALFKITKVWKQLRYLGLINELRKCGIYIQWNSIQPQRRMKFCHFQVKGWNWRISS